MRRISVYQGMLAVLIGISVVALMFVASLPHSHSLSTATHPAHACPVCRIQNGGWMAAPSQFTWEPSGTAAVYLSHPVATANETLLVYLDLSRAPPFSS